jgi:hypothetical protein
MTDRSMPKMPPNWRAPTSKVLRWFDDALPATDPRPSTAVCERLAREFQIIANRQNNAELERHGPVPLILLKDVSPAEEMDKRVRKFMSVANQLLVAANELEDYARGYQWTDGNDTISLEDVKHFLGRIGALPVARNSSPPPARGRRQQLWHAAAREIARLIIAAMRDAGYRGRLLMTDEESVTANVGAAACSGAVVR